MHATKQILDSWGDDGWELVTVMPGPNPENLVAYLKRPRASAGMPTAVGPVTPSRLAELGLELPDVAPPLAAYVPTARTGDLVFTAGPAAAARWAS